MSINNKISAALNETDRQAVIAAAVTLKTKLPFLVSLNKEERKSLRKLGSKRQGYVRDVASAVKMFPDAMPKSFNTVEYLKDADLFIPLLDVYTLLGGIFQLVDDTLLQLGNELMTNTDLIYSYLKQGAKTDSNILPILEKIQAQFKSVGKKPKTT